MARIAHEAFGLLRNPRGRVEVVFDGPAGSWTRWTVRPLFWSNVLPFWAGTLSENCVSVCVVFFFMQVHGLVWAVPWRTSVGVTLSRIKDIPQPIDGYDDPRREREWAPIMTAVALTSDRWWLKGAAAAVVVGIVTGACARSVGIRPLVSLAFAQVPAAAATMELVNRHAILRADDAVVDALASAGLDKPLSEYVCQCTQSAHVTLTTTAVLSVPAHSDRAQRMRNRLQQKWDLDVRDFVA